MNTRQIKSHNRVDSHNQCAFGHPTSNWRFWKKLQKFIAFSATTAFCTTAILSTTPVIADEQARAFEEKHYQPEKATLGWLQSIRLLPHKLRMTAKLDTGAKKSVIHAVDIEPFLQSGNEWVRFTIPVVKKKEQVELKFELPVVDQSKVKQHHTKNLDVRYVVTLDFCIAGKVYSADFSLDNRDRFNYPILLGRDFLKQHFLVDPGRTFIKKYHCS